MTTMELNAELFRQLSIIAEDESLMRKAVKAVTRLAKQKETEETEYIGKEEILKGIDAGLKEMVERKHSGNKAKTLEAVSYTHLGQAIFVFVVGLEESREP